MYFKNFLRSMAEKHPPFGRFDFFHTRPNTVFLRVRSRQSVNNQSEVNNMGTILAVCVSEKKGTQKKNIQSARLVENWGIENDAHAGNWHRQVSLLSHEKVEDFRARGAQVDDGAFGENLVISGFDFKTLPIGTKFKCNDVILELTQVGKECHAHCAIYHAMGDCIMPREGVFTRVLHGGTVSVGDTFSILEEG